MFRISILFLMVFAFFAQQTSCQKTKRNTMSKSAEDYVAAFKRGESFSSPSKGVFANGQPDESALKVLADELPKGDPGVRESIVKLLADMARTSDPLTPKGADVIRNKRILEILAGPGLAKPDMGREAAMEALRKYALARDLAQFEREFTNALAEEPTGEAFLLVAKAKTQKAKELIERLIEQPKWQDMEQAKIARAALGSKEDEDNFIIAATAAAAKGGPAFADAIIPLKLMGTQRSLRFLAEHLRTPLLIDIPGHGPGRSVKSARLDVLEALLYNYPDQPVLYPNNINQNEDYRNAERFCSETLGVVYKDPPPPFLTYGNIPD
jgi:hypothetical protein